MIEERARRIRPKEFYPCSRIWFRQERGKPIQFLVSIRELLIFAPILISKIPPRHSSSKPGLEWGLGRRWCFGPAAEEATPNRSSSSSDHASDEQWLLSAEWRVPSQFERQFPSQWSVRFFDDNDDC